jgi:hypothetical protein
MHVSEVRSSELPCCWNWRLLWRTAYCRGNPTPRLKYEDVRQHVFSTHGVPLHLMVNAWQDRIWHHTHFVVFYFPLWRWTVYCSSLYAGESQTAPRCCGTFQNIVFSFNLYVLFFLTAKLLGQTVIKLFEPNYLIKGNVRYLFWPRGAVK